jgi:hypothetical protein
VRAFLKRRWLLLSCALVLIACSAVRLCCLIRRGSGRLHTTHEFGLGPGQFYYITGTGDQSHMTHNFSWSAKFYPPGRSEPDLITRATTITPALGKFPWGFVFPGGFATGVPLWLPLSGVIGWIVLSEMRRREKMRAKETP